MHPEFTPLSGATGIEIVDPVETRRFTLRTGAPVDPTAAEPGAFPAPVDSACRISTDRLSFQPGMVMDVRAPDGTHRCSVEPPASVELPDGDHLLELNSPIKVYLRVPDPVTIEAATDRIRFDFGDEATVEVGARSFHSSPAETITVPDDPEAMMEVVSAFASALKTTSPERAWSTLRGHPPHVERGDELSIPDGLESPETGVEIRVPSEYGAVYTVAPLAYYLGAEVVPGETPRLTAGAGVEHDLGDDLEELADEVERLLKRAFLLDCVTRTEGCYPDDLREREVVESRTDLDFAALYDAPFDERLAEYLSVPDEALADVFPLWHRVTHVEADPGPGAVELLPYVVNDLALVRVNATDDEPWTPTESQKRTDDALGAFVRRATPGDGTSSAPGTAPTTRGSLEDEPESEGAESEGADAAPSARGVPGDGGYVPLPDADALEQAWIGDRTPVHGAKLLPAAFSNETPEPTDGVVDVTVVCNDEGMHEEWEAVSEIYTDRDDMQVSATCEFGVTADDLRELLAAEADLFHFIGHIDGRGFQCPDGVLDAATLDRTGATTVLLNGCRSHDQGIALVETGARAAVVSLADLWNSGAVEVGETLARLFHHGLTVGSAVELVREHTSLGREYVVVGDPGISVAQCSSGTPAVHHVSEESEEQVSVRRVAYPIRNPGVGSTTISFLPGAGQYHVGLGEAETLTMHRETFREAVADWSIPLVYDEKLVWSSSWAETV